jgi:hypothetical protein
VGAIVVVVFRGALSRVTKGTVITTANNTNNATNPIPLQQQYQKNPSLRRLL